MISPFLQMSVLESAEDEKSAAAISYLLGLLIPRLVSLLPATTSLQDMHISNSVPREVLQLKYGTSCKILTDQLARHGTTSSTALLKSVGLFPLTPCPQALSLLLPLSSWCVIWLYC